MRATWQRLISLFRTNRLDRDLNDEIEVHLAMQAEEFRQKGMDPVAARRAAHREFGGVAQAQESYREQRGVAWLEIAVKDCRYALRGLRRSPGFTAAAVLSLALGIGANTAIFSLFDALLLRSLPVDKPQQLISLYRTGAWGRGYASYPLYLEVQKRTDLFQDVVARSLVEKVRFSFGQGDSAETAQREFVTGNYFSVLGVGSSIGRVFNPDDNRQEHAHPLAVLSYDFWRTRFGADPAILGRTVIVGEQPLTIIGVAARGFRGVEVEHHPDLWVPAMMAEGEIMQPGRFWVWILGRRRPEVSRAQIQAAVSVLFRQHLASVYGSQPNAAFRKTAMAQQIEVRDGGIGISLLRDRFAKPLAVLMAAVLLVLLAACANVANLLIARGAARSKEIALRLSLGATRGRLIRQGLMESILLTVSGCSLGVLLAVWGVRAMLQFLPATSGDPLATAPSPTVLAFTMGLSILSVALFGLAPAVRSTAVDLAGTIKSGGGHSGGESRMRRGLVVAQVAFSVVLVALASLFGHSLGMLRSMDLGFRNQSVVSSTLDFANTWKPQQIAAARERLVMQMAALPGVSQVSYGTPGPFLGGFSNSSILIPGSPVADKEPIWVSLQSVSPGYFDILSSPLLAGRDFNRSDTSANRKVALVNQAFVEKLLSNSPHPLDKVMSFDMAKIDPTYIVGVVANISHQGLREKVVPTVYLPITQRELAWGDILVRSDLSTSDVARAVSRAVIGLGPGVTNAQPRTIRQHIDESIFQDRLLARVGSFFGGLALLLAALGLYGVVSYGVARRTREIGIRLALGARRGVILRMAVSDSFLLVILGLILGLPFAFAAARAVATLLLDVKPADLSTFGATAGALLIVALAAAFLPARRALSIQPVQVLRHE